MRFTFPTKHGDYLRCFLVAFWSNGSLGLEIWGEAQDEVGEDEFLFRITKTDLPVRLGTREICFKQNELLPNAITLLQNLEIVDAPSKMRFINNEKLVTFPINWDKLKQTCVFGKRTQNDFAEEYA